MGELQAELNRLAGTTGLDAQGAANVYAGTTGLDLIGALNVAAGTSGLELLGVLNSLAGTTGLGVNAAAALISSQVSPSDIDDGAAWFKADSLSLSDSDPVTTWTDSFDSDNDVTQATADKKPLYIANALNGNPVVRFDGTNDLLVRSAADAVSVATEGLVFLVLKLVATNRTILSSGDEAVATRQVSLRTGATGIPLFSQRNADTADTVNATNTLGTDAFRVLTMGSTGTAYKAWIDGTAETLSVSAGADTGDWFGDVSARDSFTVGALKTSSESAFFGGDIAELIVYDRFLTDGERGQVHDYLASKYGLTVA